VVAFALSYRIGDIEPYYLTSHLMVALWIGVGLRVFLMSFARWTRQMRVKVVSRRWLSRAAGAVTAFVLPALLLQGNWQANNETGDRNALRVGRAILDALPPNAFLVVHQDNYQFPVQYERFVEGYRRDVTVVPFGNLIYPARLALVTRLQRQNLIVPVPECYSRDRDSLTTHKDGCLIGSILTANAARRPTYLYGISHYAIEHEPKLHAVMPGFTEPKPGLLLITPNSAPGDALGHEEHGAAETKGSKPT
jgi:hypothetical protein